MIVNTVQEFVSQIEDCKGSSFIYRGLADIDWNIASYAYRLASLLELSVLRYLESKLDETKMRGFNYENGREHSDLEILARIQHQQSATCLMDFTYNPLIALWFACKYEVEKDAKVIAIDSQSTIPIPVKKYRNTVSVTKLENDKTKFVSVVDKASSTDLSKLSFKELHTNINKLFQLNKLWKWQPSHLSERITAQSSIFIFSNEDLTKIDTENVKVIRISNTAKIKICKELKENYGIDRKTIFPDFEGYYNQELSKEENTTAELVQQYINSGIDNHQLGNYHEAIQNYTTAIELNLGETSAGFNKRGCAYMALNQVEEAIQDFTKAINDNLEDELAYFNRGNAFMVLSRHKEALNDYSNAIKYNKNEALYYSSRGNAYLRLRFFKNAINDYEVAIKQNSNDPAVFCNLGNARTEFGQTDQALKDLQMAINLVPEYSAAFMNIGNVHAKLKKHEEAIQNYDKAIKFDPKNSFIFLNRGLSYLALKKYNKSIDDFTQSILLSRKNFAAYFNRGVAHLEFKLYQKAITDFDSAINFSPNNAKACQYRDEAYTKLEQLDKSK